MCLGFTKGKSGSRAFGGMPDLLELLGSLLARVPRRIHLLTFPMKEDRQQADLCHPPAAAA